MSSSWEVLRRPFERSWPTAVCLKSWTNSCSRQRDRTARSPPPAEYLGLGESDLRARLASGWSLGEIALDAGRTEAGLERALLADLERHLDADVAAGRVPPRRRPLIASAVRAWIVELV